MSIQKGFTRHSSNGVSFLTIPSFDRLGGVCCAFSTRIGGVSPKPYDSLNFSRKRENNPQNFSENLMRFGVAAGFDSTQAVGINYAHSAAVLRVYTGEKGRGIIREPLSQICDGLCSDTKGLPLVSFHADCVPLFFYDPVRCAVAVCHAGWRGVAEHITQHAVHALADIGCKVQDIYAAVGPCISVKHFEVGHDVYELFRRTFGNAAVLLRDGRFYVDLNSACVSSMLQSGLKPAHITDAALCTFGDAQLFFSHRRDHGQTGAMAAVIALL